MPKLHLTIGSLRRLTSKASVLGQELQDSNIWLVCSVQALSDSRSPISHCLITVSHMFCSLRHLNSLFGSYDTISYIQVPRHDYLPLKMSPFY